MPINTQSLISWKMYEIEVAYGNGNPFQCKYKKKSGKRLHFIPKLSVLTNFNNMQTIDVFLHLLLKINESNSIYNKIPEINDLVM